jgi:peptidoglycan hydrolase-like protein with peptidoglycan-binding domain
VAITLPRFSALCYQIIANFSFASPVELVSAMGSNCLVVEALLEITDFCRKTWAKITRNGKGGAQLMNSGPTLSIGTTGHDVRRIQRIFVMTKALPPSDITGSFDATTEQAVKDFQEGAGLTVDGIVGPQTWQALPADPNTPTLSRGASGGAVTGLQKGLKKYSTSATDPGPVDGDFGPKTEAAVKAYQQDRGVHVDGIVGDQTWWVPAGAAGATLASLSGLTTV